MAIQPVLVGTCLLIEAFIFADYNHNLLYQSSFPKAKQHGRPHGASINLVLVHMVKRGFALRRFRVVWFPAMGA